MPEARLRARASPPTTPWLPASPAFDHKVAKCIRSLPLLREHRKLRPERVRDAQLLLVGILQNAPEEHHPLDLRHILGQLGHGLDAHALPFRDGILAVEHEAPPPFDLPKCS